jgi:hypothetical protein
LTFVDQLAVQMVAGDAIAGNRDADTRIDDPGLIIEREEKSVVTCPPMADPPYKAMQSGPRIH